MDSSRCWWKRLSWRLLSWFVGPTVFKHGFWVLSEVSRLQLQLFQQLTYLVLFSWLVPRMSAWESSKRVCMLWRALQTLKGWRLLRRTFIGLLWMQEWAWTNLDNLSQFFVFKLCAQNRVVAQTGLRQSDRGQENYEHSNLIATRKTFCLSTMSFLKHVS